MDFLRIKPIFGATKNENGELRCFLKHGSSHKNSADFELEFKNASWVALWKTENLGRKWLQMSGE